MNIISKTRLERFYEKNPQAEQPLRAWFKQCKSAKFKSTHDVKGVFGNKVDFAADNRVIFDISGNKYRLIVYFDYPRNLGLIKFIGTHSEYDKIDVETIQ